MGFHVHFVELYQLQHYGVRAELRLKCCVNLRSRMSCHALNITVLLYHFAVNSFSVLIDSYFYFETYSLCSFRSFVHVALLIIFMQSMAATVGFVLLIIFMQSMAATVGFVLLIIFMQSVAATVGFVL